MPPGQRSWVTLRLLGGIEHVGAVALRVGELRALLEDAAVDAAAEVLDEVAVELGVDVADGALGVDLDAGFQGGSLRGGGTAKRRRRLARP